MSPAALQEMDEPSSPTSFEPTEDEVVSVRSVLKISNVATTTTPVRHLVGCVSASAYSFHDVAGFQLG